MACSLIGTIAPMRPHLFVVDDSKFVASATIAVVSATIHLAGGTISCMSEKTNSDLSLPPPKAIKTNKPLLKSDEHIVLVAVFLSKQNTPT